MHAHLLGSFTPPRSPHADPAAKAYLHEARRERIVGFFPGLGSRAAYQDLDRSLLDSGIDDVVSIYHEGARALGCPGEPEKLLLVPANMPAGKLEKEGFIGAAFMVHNLALEAHLRAVAEEGRAAVDFAGYTGESFGILISAVASGSLSVIDGIRIARVFTPLMLVAAEGDDHGDPLARKLVSYLPESVRGKRLVQEPFHVVALQGDSEDLTEAIDSIGRFYPRADVEVHKTYSRWQANVYVRSGVRSGFGLFMRNFPGVRTAELKAPTTFLAHSERMHGVREALSRFIEENGIVFTNPHTPVISNHGTALLTTAADVRDGILAMTNEVMASRATVQTLDGLSPDLILEFGLGGKSVQLLADNGIEAPVMAYTGTADETDLFLKTVKLAGDLREMLRKLHASGDRLEARHYRMLRELFRVASQAAFSGRYFYQAMHRVITGEMLGAASDGSPAFYRFLEAFQNTYRYRDAVNIEAGQLVLQARLKKTITGRPERLGQAYTELEVLEEIGDTVGKCLTDSRPPEAMAIHLGWPADSGHADLARKTRLLLQAQPLARQVYDQLPQRLRIDDESLPPADADDPHDAWAAARQVAYLYASFLILRCQRPAIFAQSDHYLVAGSPVGWLAALAASGAASLTDVVDALGSSGLASGADAALARAMDRLSSSLSEPDMPIISPAGVPLHAKRDLAAATLAVFQDGNGTPVPQVLRIHLNGYCQILALGAAVAAAQVDAGPYQADVICVRSAAEIWGKGANPALDLFEEHCVLGLTSENEKILRYAQGRRMLASMVSAYTGIGEAILGFGKGGSESMTMFLRKRGEDRITVRKILSEALTTVSWDPKGAGVMLPPFTKARKQAEYLQELPESVQRYFPVVHDVLEREISIPHHSSRGHQATCREVIYEMSYVPGEEVSRFVEKQNPPPAVIARLYAEIFRILHCEIHTINRVPAPGDTLEVSYFKKIEDRLALCRRTAPGTFSPELLDAEHIVVNGISYLNSSALSAVFRSRPEFLRILEPRFHSLVVGDTNTENIKITDSGPLLHAQRLIDTGAPEEDIDAALSAITAESVGLRFLDPRAIGFNGDGAHTRDDPMYDNKPWHNCLGHYDEIHYEMFELRVQTGAGHVPHITIEFRQPNPYQRAYRVKDITARGGKPGQAAMPEGMEECFGPVMTAVYGLADPESQYVKDDPYWLIRFVFMMGTHFTAMPPFHFQSELDGTLVDTSQAQRRPVAIYCEGIKWLNWALEMLEGKRTEFLGIQVPPLPYLA